MDPSVQGGRPCPFCGAPALYELCPGCGQNPTAPRRPCKACGKVTPTANQECMHCGAKRRSDMPGKVLLIIAMFIAALILSIILHSL